MARGGIWKGLLGGLAGGFTGYGQQQQQRTQLARQQADDTRSQGLYDLQVKQYGNAEAERARQRTEEQEGMKVLRDNWAAASGGDLDAQARLLERHPTLAGQFKVTERAPATPVSWQTVETPQGYVQVNPQTAQTRPVGAPVGGGQLQPKPPAPANPDMENQRRFARSQKLGEDYQKNPAVKNAYELAKVTGGINAALAGNAPVDDLSTLYEVVKLFDPTSVVREGEIKLFRSAQSLPQELRSIVARWNSGRLLLPEMREQINALMGRKVGESRKSVAPVQSDYGRQARQWGVSSDSSFIAPDPFMGIGGQPLPNNPYRKR